MKFHPRNAMGTGPCRHDILHAMVEIATFIVRSFVVRACVRICTVQAGIGPRRGEASCTHVTIIDRRLTVTRLSDIVQEILYTDAIAVCDVPIAAEIYGIVEKVMQDWPPATPGCAVFCPAQRQQQTFASSQGRPCSSRSHDSQVIWST